MYGGGVSRLLLVLGTLFLSIALLGCPNVAAGGGTQGGGENPGGSGEGQEMPSENQVTVTFSLDGGTWQDGTQNSQTITKGTKVTLPTAPKKTGDANTAYEFAGWYADSSFNTLFNFDTEINENTTIYAKWTEQKVERIKASDIATLNFKSNTKYVFDDTITQYNFNSVAENLKATSGTSNIKLDFSACSNVTSIGNSAFSGCKSLASITIPSSVTTIENDAFSGCTGLTSITIPSSVTSIGGYAFCQCNNLETVTAPGEVFYRISSDLKNSLKTAIIAEGSKKIKSSLQFPAFKDCTALTSVTIPEGVTTIEDYAFDGCTALTSVTIPSSVTSIGGYAFQNCTSLASITIPASVTTISHAAFSNCTGLTSITIPASVTSIEGYAFSGCTGLTEINIPSSVTTIEYNAFDDWTSSQTITVAWEEGEKPSDWNEYWNDSCQAKIIYNGGK